MFDVNGGYPPVQPDAIESREDLAAALTRQREHAGLTVRDVAKRTGVPVGTVSGYFSGRHVPPISALPQVHAVLSVCGVQDPAELAQWTEAIARVRRAPGRRPADSPVPYKGLASFATDEAEWFFGREKLTDRIVAELTAPDLGLPVVVVGPSGSGKSSLLRAGVVPAMQARGYRCLVMTPGHEPTRTLSHLLPRESGTQVLVAIDPAEELYTVTDEAERTRFAAMLRRLADVPGTRVVLGLRSDFYSATLKVPDLVPSLERHQVLVGPMTDEELRRVITEPALRAGVEVQDGLVDVLLRDLARRDRGLDGPYDSGSLPLLSHALLTTWERMSRGRLTVADYRDAGGVDGAVNATAERTYAGLTADEQEAARRLLLALVHVVDGMALARRQVPRSQLPAVGQVLERFVDSRLLLADDETVQIAHGALLRAWPRLRDWIAEDQEGLRLRQQLATAAEFWRDNGRDPHLLRRGPLLTAALEWADDASHLSPDSREFLDASVAAADDAADIERRRNRRLRTLSTSLALLLMAASALVAVSFQEKASADHHRDTAISRQMADAAIRLASTDIAPAQQLALAAYRTAPTQEARSALLSMTALPTVTRLAAAGGVLQAVAIGSGGRRLLTAGADGARLWDLSGSPRLVRRLAGANGIAYAAAISRDGTRAAVAGADATVRVWPVEGEGGPQVLTGPSGTVYTLAFGPDGTLVAGDANGGVTVWLTGRAAAVRLPSAGNAVHAVAVTSDGRLLAVAAGPTIQLWRLESFTKLGPALDVGKEVSSVAFDPAGMRLAAGSRDDAVHLYDVGDPVHVRAERTLTAPTEWVNSVAFSPDGRTVLAGSSDAQVRRWNATTGELLDTLPHPGPVTGVAVSPAGDVVATADNDGTARLWHLPTPSVTAAAANLFGVTELPGRGLIATAAKDELRLWRMAGGLTPIGPRLRAPAPYGPLSGPIATSPNGQLVAAGGADGAVHLYDVSHPNAPRLVSTVTGPTALVEGVTISPDGRTLAAGSDDRTVWLWDISRPSAAHPLTHLIGPGNYVQSVAFGPKGQTLAAGDADNDVWLWDVSSPSRPVRLAGPMHGPRSYVYAVTISPDGRTLAAASDDKSVWLWDVSDRRHPKPLGRLQGSDSFLFAVSFSTDGRTLAAASGDGSVWLWDVHDVHHPVATATLTGAVGPLFAAAFLADGRVAAGGTDRMIRLWQTSPNLAARQVCRGIGVPISRAEWGRYVPGVPYAPPCR